MATANQQIQIAANLPASNWSDQSLSNWVSANQGKVVFGANGQQIQIPKSSNPGTVRSWINNGILKGASLTDPGAPGGAAQTAGAAAAGSPSASGTSTDQSSYLSNPTQGNASMASLTSSSTGQPQVTPQQAIDFYRSSTGIFNVDPATAMSFFTSKNPNFGASGVTAQNAINYYVGLGGSAKIDPATAISFYEAKHPDELAKGVTNAALTPEQRANQQLATIDPASEALRTAVANSYLTPLQQAAQGGPNATQLQSYLDTYKSLDPAGYAQKVALGQGVSDQVSQAGDLVKQASDFVSQVTGQAPKSAADALAQYQQLDPKGYASMVALGGSEDASLKQATDQLNLGSQLDPVTQRQVEQQTRAGQAARGNVYGTPQMVSEAMTTGQAGLALQAQRQAAAQAAQSGMQNYLTSGATPGAVGQAGYQTGLTNRTNAYGVQQAAMGTRGAALGAQQSYLQSGQSLGDTALNLYNQNQNNLRANQSGAINYLGSGQTPYQAGASYLGAANADAANASQGGPVYNPTALGQGTAGTSQQAPQYGLDVGAQATNWYNSLQAGSQGGGGAPQKNRTVSAATGALSGAAAGATAGSVVPVYGTAIGAGVGAIAGGLGGYYS